MNERIKELANQSRKVVGYTDGGYTELYGFDHDKFAKLIIKECADFVQFYYKDHACEVIAHDMKQHFGVQ